MDERNDVQLTNFDGVHHPLHVIFRHNFQLKIQLVRY